MYRTYRVHFNGGRCAWWWKHNSWPASDVRNTSSSCRSCCCWVSISKCVLIPHETEGRVSSNQELEWICMIWLVHRCQLLLGFSVLCLFMYCWWNCCIFEEVVNPFSINSHLVMYLWDWSKRDFELLNICIALHAALSELSPSK